MRNVLPWAMALVLWAGCDQNSLKNAISGKIQGAEGQTLYLERRLNDRFVRTDSTTVGADGKFLLVANEPLNLDYYKLTLDKDHFVLLITDSTEEVQIESNAESMKLASTVSGSPNTSALFEYYGEMKPFVDKMTAIQESAADQSITQEAREQLKSEFIELQKQKSEVCKTWIQSNPESPAALAALRELDIRADLPEYHKVLDALKEKYGQVSLYQEINRQVESQEMMAQQQAIPATPPAGEAQQLTKEQMNLPEYQQKIQEMQKQQMQQMQAQQQRPSGPIAVGVQAPEIAQKNPEGKVLKLSDYRGKVVLIDFWASWCGPCRRENPNVVAAYAKYKSKGFDVFSVSLDNSPEKWKAAIAQDGLLWKNHVSDLAGWSSVVARDYGVRSIPFPVLIDKQGKVVNFGGNIRGPLLEEELAKLLGN